VGNGAAAAAVLSASACGGYVAAMDPATRGNAWTLVVLGVDKRDGANAWRVVLARQWQGSSLQPLSPTATLAEVRRLVEPYGLGGRVPVWTDQWGFDAINELAGRVGLRLAMRSLSGPERTRAYENMRSAVQANRLELPPDPVVRNDLRGVQKVVNHTGVTVKLARTADGRHCDYAAALALLFAVPPDIMAQERKRKADRHYARIRAQLAGEDLREWDAREAEAERDREARAEWLKSNPPGDPEAGQASAFGAIRKRIESAIVW
jgi:hypothetical protein